MSAVVISMLVSQADIWKLACIMKSKLKICVCQHHTDNESKNVYSICQTRRMDNKGCVFLQIVIQDELLIFSEMSIQTADIEDAVKTLS